MNVIEAKPRPSTEADIDRKTEELLGRILSGDATDRDRIQYRELSADRSSRMMQDRVIFRKGNFIRR